jgi:hypothetical protein
MPDADVSTRLRRYLDGEDVVGDLDLIEPDDLEPCPSCGAQSAAVGYGGHGMHCRRYYREEEP